MPSSIRRLLTASVFGLQVSLACAAGQATAPAASLGAATPPPGVVFGTLVDIRGSGDASVNAGGRGEVKASLATGRFASATGGGLICNTPPCADIGSAMGFAELASSGFQPTLKAKAFTSPQLPGVIGPAVQATVTTMQIFDVTVARAASSLTLDLSGINGGGLLASELLLFKVTNPANPTYLDFLRSGLYMSLDTAREWSFARDALDVPYFKLLGQVSQSIDAGTGYTQLSDVLQLPAMAAGDRLMLWARLDTAASDGADVDAANTLVAHFDSTAGLLPQGVPAPVPEPATCVLMAAGGLLLAARARRRMA